MSQPVWFFGKPTIRYCMKHDTTEFVYTEGKGCVCSALGCTKEMWVDFECTNLAFHDAEEKAQEGP